MHEGLRVAKQAPDEIERWLWTRPETVDVHNVEDKIEYQEIDVDLLWTTERKCYKAKIKGDRWERTGSFIFETMSNKKKGIKGSWIQLVSATRG